MNRDRQQPPIDPLHPALSPTRPLFIDNREGNTLARALIEHLRTLRGEMALPWEMCIASGFFTVSGFNLLAGELEHMARVRLLLGAEPRPEATIPPRRPEDPPEPAFTRGLVSKALTDLDEGLARARDLMPFDEPTDAALRRMLSMLHATGSDGHPKIEVRRYEEQFLHAKAYIFRTVGGGTVVGSSNLTYSGLRGNLELNLGHYEDAVVGKVETWFDELWDKAAPYDLATIFDRLMAEYPPYLIYMRVLYALYGEELEQEEQELRQSGQISLTTFQQHGVWRALRILRQRGGVLVADGVGLGKTFLAGEIIRRYRERRQRVLLICPAALRNSTWRRFLDKHELFVDCISYEQLANDSRLGGTHETLKYPPEDYALVVVDEAHNYRNPRSESRVPAFRRLLMGQRRDLVMLSATPVNNSLWDLFYALRYFIKQDAAFADRGIISMKDRFKEAEDLDAFDLDPDMLYPIIDATTVKRTRKFIRRHYSNDMIDLPDGRSVPIQFPRPIPHSVNYDLDAILPGFVDKLEEYLCPEDKEPLIRMARYQVHNYSLAEPVEGDERHEPQVVGFLRSALLKRFESSVRAFANTTQKMVRDHDRFLRALEGGRVLTREAFEELSATDDEEEIDAILAGVLGSEPAEEYDVDALRSDVLEDRRLLQELHTAAAAVKQQDDPKLARLIEEIDAIAKEANREGLDALDKRRKRKILVFSAFTDTIDWIESFVDSLFGRDARLTPYEGRTASVAGDEARQHVSRDAAVRGFSPESMDVPDPAKEDRFDLLLSTDVLAEGMNLQQCRHIINFDMPWNPMRLVQRHGRIDRIGSPHGEVHLRTFFPDKELDRLLRLEERVRKKLAKAAASIGVEATPIERGAVGDQSFAETRDEIERLHQEDSSIYEDGGSGAAAQSGEEYRQELRKALGRYRDEIVHMPWKAGSGIAKGAERGHFFCAVVGKRTYLRFVPVSAEAKIVTEIGTCLRMIECQEQTLMVLPLDLKQTAYAAWTRARGDIHEAWTRETDPANLQPKVSKLNREVARFLLDHPPAGMDQTRVDRCREAIESPCSRREENMLREVFDRQFESLADRSKAIIEEVERIGLEPFASPPPLPPIQPDEIHLLCWMAIECLDSAVPVSPA